MLIIMRERERERERTVLFIYIATSTCDTNLSCNKILPESCHRSGNIQNAQTLISLVTNCSFFSTYEAQQSNNPAREAVVKWNNISYIYLLIKVNYQVLVISYFGTLQ